jgi:hypothetical protein
MTKNIFIVNNADFVIMEKKKIIYIVSYAMNVINTIIHINARSVGYVIKLKTENNSIAITVIFA